MPYDEVMSGLTRAAIGAVSPWLPPQWGQLGFIAHGAAVLWLAAASRGFLCDIREVS